MQDFVGHNQRDLEVDYRDLLNEAFEAVLSKQSCHLVTVLGMSGVGKSRLVDEFRSQVEVAKPSWTSNRGLVNWYADQWLPEWSVKWSPAASHSSLLPSSEPKNWPKLDSQPWTTTFESDRWLSRLEGDDLVSVYLDTGGSDLDARVVASSAWHAEDAFYAENQDCSADSVETWLFDGVARLEAVGSLRRQARVFARCLALRIRRKLRYSECRVRRVGQRVHRRAIRPLTMSVTVHAPPRSSHVEGYGTLRQSLLAA